MRLFRISKKKCYGEPEKWFGIELKPLSWYGYDGEGHPIYTEGYINSDSVMVEVKENNTWNKRYISCNSNRLPLVFRQFLWVKQMNYRYYLQMQEERG